jgi:Domain of unknown function (DUF4349)/Putative zinc-finger
MNKTTHPIDPEELMAYLDGELSNDKAGVAAAHLSECAECRAVVTELRGVSQALKAWDVGLADSRVSTAISTALEEEARKQGKAPIPSRPRTEVFRHRWQALAWIGAPAAIALVAYVGSVNLRGRNPNGVSSHVGQTMNDESGSDRDHLPAPPAGPVATRQFDRLEQFAKLNKAPKVDFGDKITSPTVSGPMIVRTAGITLITREFDKARSGLESILKRHRGYVGELKVGGTSGTGRSLTATLRVPVDQLDATLIEMKTLGRVEWESQNGEDVTSQYVDLEARLANALNTERRLTDLLKERTGKLSDVLAVENEHARVRGEIEQMEAERKTMSNQVSFATLNATITEDYKAQLQVVPPSTSTRLSNAAVEGYKSMVDGIVSLVLFLLEDGPTLLLWGAVLFFPARWVWKRVRHHGFAH